MEQYFCSMYLNNATVFQSLWILSNNDRANAFYKKYGFIKSGKKKQLRNDLFEVELILCNER